MPTNTPVSDLCQLVRKINVYELKLHAQVLAGATLLGDVVRQERREQREKLAALCAAVVRSGVRHVGLSELEARLNAIQAACDGLSCWESVDGPTSAPATVFAAELPQDLHREQVRQLLTRLHVSDGFLRGTYGVEDLAALTADQVEDVRRRLLTREAQRDYLRERGEELDRACAGLKHLVGCQSSTDG